MCIFIQLKCLSDQYSYWSIVLLSVYLYICTLSKVIKLYIIYYISVVEGNQFAQSEKLSLVWVERRPRRQVELCLVITSSWKGENSITSGYSCHDECTSG